MEITKTSKKSIKIFNSAKNTLEIHMGENVALIDREDAVLFFSYSYAPIKKHNVWYLYRNGDNRTHAFHSDIMKTPPGLEVDHINNNGLDNRKANLRIVSHRVNQLNLRKKIGSSSNFIGVYKCRERKNWVAQCNLNGKTVNVGRFDLEEEAAWARENFIIINRSESRRNFNAN